VVYFGQFYLFFVIEDMPVCVVFIIIFYTLAVKVSGGWKQRCSGCWLADPWKGVMQKYW